MRKMGMVSNKHKKEAGLLKSSTASALCVKTTSARFCALKAALRRRFFKKEPSALDREIEQALDSCRRAEAHFYALCDPARTDCAIYEMEAANRRYAYLVSLRRTQSQKNAGDSAF